MDPKQFTQPRGRLPVRLPTYPDTRQTALVSLERVSSAKIDTISGTAVSFALLPDPAYPVWTNRVQSAITYSITYNFNPTISTPAVAVACSTDKLPLIGVASSRMFMYTHDKVLDFQISVVGTTFTAVNPVKIVLNYYLYSPEGEMVLQQAPITFAGVVGSADTSVVSATLAGKWISVHTIELTDPGTTAASYTSANLLVQNTYSGTVRAWYPEDYRAPIEWSSSTEPYQACRITASQLTIFNVTSTLNREGTVSAVRLQAAKIQPWDASTTNLSDAPPSLRYVAPLDKGIETFSVPAATSSTFTDHARVVIPLSAGTLLPNIDLTMNYQYVFMDLVDPSTTTQTNLALTYHEHREFCASSQLFNVGVSPYTIDQFVRVMQRVVMMPPARAAQQAAFGPMLMPTQPTRETVNARRSGAPRRGRKQRRQRAAAPPQPKPKPPARPKSGLDMYLASRGKGMPRRAPRAPKPPARRNGAP